MSRSPLRLVDSSVRYATWIKRNGMKILTTAIVALALHLTLGWAWTLGAGIAGGAWAVRRGWLVGAAGVALEWAALVGYNLIVAAGPVRELARVLGGLLGNLPGWVVVLLTVLLGAALGALGGFIGTQAARLLRTAG